MAKKQHYKESKEQKEKQALFDHMEKEISKIRSSLKALYSIAGDPGIVYCVNEGFIHHQIEMLDRVKHLIWDLLVDEIPPKEILGELKNL